jgi:hypothetical protein
MGDPAVVRVLQRRRDLAQDAHRLGDRELTGARDACTEGLPLDVGHREERQVRNLPGQEHRHNVRMLQSRGDHDLALEALEAHLRGKLWREYLHDDLAAERDLGGEKDARHPPAGELLLDRVRGAKRRLELGAEVGDHAMFGRTASGNEEAAGAGRRRNAGAPPSGCLSPLDTGWRGDGWRWEAVDVVGI